jgi:hypothetical protein
METIFVNILGVTISTQISWKYVGRVDAIARVKN